MNARLKHILKNVFPPFITSIWQNRYGKVRFSAAYDSWQQARQKSSGYDQANILSKAIEVNQMMMDRDRTLLKQSRYLSEPSLPLQSVLLAASQGGETLNVADFGGALGSVYWLNRELWEQFSDIKLNWCVIEQPHFVEYGKKNLPEPVRFYHSFSELPAEFKPHVIIFSSVLQFLENYGDFLQQAMTLKPQYIFIDRTPLLPQTHEEYIAVQYVPPCLGQASYPIRFIGELSLAELLTSDYDKIAEFNDNNPEIWLKNYPDPVYFKGSIWKRHCEE